MATAPRLGLALSLALVLGCGGRPLGGSSGNQTGDVAARDARAEAAMDAVDAAAEAAMDAAAEAAMDAAAEAAMDAEGRVLADATAGADGGDAGDAAPRRPRVLSLVLSGAPWYSSQSVQGMAADAKNRVYIQDSSKVYLVEGNTVGTYLTVAEALGEDSSSTVESIGDLDLGPDGLLYVLVGGFPSLHIIRSSAAHTAQPWLDLSGKLNVPGGMSLFTAGVVGIVDRDGFKVFSDAGGGLVYPQSMLKAQSGCATEDLAAAPSGVFLYQSGCNGYPIVRGNRDGSGVGVLYETDTLPGQRSPVANFLCEARDPAGGFYVMVGDFGSGGPRLVHLTEDASGANGVDGIETTPSFAQAKTTQAETFAFYYCSLAVSPDGTVFYQTYHQLWKVSPP